MIVMEKREEGGYRSLCGSDLWPTIMGQDPNGLIFSFTFFDNILQ